jgi:hypothetical protein
MPTRRQILCGYNFGLLAPYTSLRQLPVPNREKDHLHVFQPNDEISTNKRNYSVLNIIKSRSRC